MTKSKKTVKHINVHDAKTHLSHYLTEVEAGEELVLCRNNRPVAKITPISRDDHETANRFGLGKGMGKVTKSFFDPLTDDELPGFGL